MRLYTVPPVNRAFPQEWINGKVPTSAMAIENIRTMDEANEERALARDPDGVLLEIFERPDWVPAADHSVMLGVGVTVNDLELFSEDLVEGFNFQPEADLFEHARHWDLDGSLEKCRTAFTYGADAVYVGGKEYSLRASARNLNREELAALCFLARKLEKKVYVAVNTFARNSDIRALPSFLEYLRDIRVDAIIVSDPGVLALARIWAPGVSLHLSTQANTTNSLGTVDNNSFTTRQSSNFFWGRSQLIQTPRTSIPTG